MKPSVEIRSIAKVATVALGCLVLPACQPKAPPGNYDLVAGSVIVKPAVVHVGNKVTLEHTVRNDGKDTVPGGTYYVDLYVDGKSVSFDRGTCDLGPGQKSEYGMDWIPDKPGKYRYRLVIDEANNLSESDEANNVLDGDIQVLP